MRMPQTCRLAAIVVAAASLAACRTATTLAGDRDLYAEAARPPPEPPGQRPIVGLFCGLDGVADLRAALASRPRAAGQPDLVVEASARYLGHETVGAGEAAGMYTWDIVVGIPAVFLPLPVFYGGEYRVEVAFLDRETRIERSRRALTFSFRGTTYWVWGLIGARMCHTDHFAPLAVPLIEEEVRRLSLPEERRSFLAAARGLLEVDRGLLAQLAAGASPVGPPRPEESPWGQRDHGTGRLRSTFQGRIRTHHTAELDPVTRQVRSQTSSDGAGVLQWLFRRQALASDGEWSYPREILPGELLATAEYAWHGSWGLVRFTATPALPRAIAENQAALRRLEERERALGP